GRNCLPHGLYQRRRCASDGGADAQEFLWRLPAAHAGAGSPRPARPRAGRTRPPLRVLTYRIMNVIRTSLPGVVIVEPTVHRDERRFFLETYHADRYREHGVDVRFVQDNHSRSVQGTLRGLHWQIERPQGKLVRVLLGEIYDVVVDIRPDAPTFGQWV